MASAGARHFFALVRRAHHALVLVAAVALVAAPARADDDQEKAQARMLLSQGNALFEKGDLRAALADFRAAYALYPSPKLLVNAAAAERELGDVAGAATDLRHFIDDASDDDQALVERARGDLRGLEKRVARIGISGWPPRSTLEIDGRQARDPTYVKPGAHSVKAQSPAGAEMTKELEVNAGDAIELPAPPPPRTSPRAVPLVDNNGVVMTPPPKKSHKAGMIAGIVVGSIVVVGGAIALGVVLGSPPSVQPLDGKLGTYKFSDFH